MSTSVLLVDDHPVFRKGLRLLLDEEPDMRVVGEAGDGQEAIERVRGLAPDVVVMDITMPGLNGIEATRQIVSEFSNTKVVALSIHSGKHFVEDMLRAGAAGYLLKESVPEELVNGIRIVMEGDVYLSASITGIVVEQYLSALSHVPALEDIGDPAALLLTKLHRPPIAPDILPRDRLLKQIDLGRGVPLTLVSAPAGYGKSTLASRWLERCGPHCAWLSLDERDNDTRLFLSYILKALESVFPDIGQKTLPLLTAPMPTSSDVLARTLLNDLDTLAEPFILVLDDYHVIHEKEVHDLLAAILHHPPRAMHLVMLTRRDPPLPLGLLRARGHLNEISMEELRFTGAETAAYLEQTLHTTIDAAAAAAIEERIEGWVAGLRLAALSLRNRKNLDRFLSGLQGGFQYIADYLISEVLSQQPPSVSCYLMETSILDRFCAALCESIHTSDQASKAAHISGSDFVEWLLDANLFVVPLDSENRWFRYHHLFQQLLRNQLKRHRNGDAIASLHARASAWFAKKGYIDEAIRHALSAGDMPGAAQLVERNRQAILNGDRWYVLEKWLSLFPETIALKRPRMLMVRAWVLYHHFDIPKIPSVIDEAEALLGDAAEDQHLRGEIDFFRGYIDYFTNQGARSLEHLDAASKKIPGTHHEIRGQVEILHGLASQMQGQKDKAIHALNDLLYHQSLPQNVRTTRLLATLSFIHIVAGDMIKALDASQALYDVAQREGYAHTKAWSEYLLGLIHFYRNDLKSATDYWGQACEHRHVLHARAALDSMAGLALSYQIMGQPDPSGGAMEDLFEYAALLDAPAYQMIAEASFSRLSIMRGEPKSLAGWFPDNAPPAENMAWWLEIPVLTHCRALLAEGSDQSLEKAETMLGQLLQLNRDNHNVLNAVRSMCLLAVLYGRQARPKEALANLQGAVELAEPGDLSQPFVEAGPGSTELLKRLIDKKVAVNFIEKVLGACRSRTVPPSSGRPVPSSYQAPVPQPLVEPLTNRELDVLELLAQRLQTKEMSEKLFISTETVKTHLKNIYQKLQVGNRRQAVQAAESLGILKRP